MSQVLVVSPHWDDEVIGCGGSLRKHADHGNDVAVVTIVERGRSAFDKGVDDEAFHAEVMAAHDVLGIKRHVALNERERGLASSRELLLRLVAVFREVRPDVVYVPDEDELDIEHQLTHRLAMEAMWMAESHFFEEVGEAIPRVELVLGYEVWSPMRRYQYVEAVDAEIEAKVAAMRCYASQLHHASWDEAIRGLAAYRGATTTGGGYAEVFSVLRWSPDAAARLVMPRGPSTGDPGR